MEQRVTYRDYRIKALAAKLTRLSGLRPRTLRVEVYIGPSLEIVEAASGLGPVCDYGFPVSLISTIQSWSCWVFGTRDIESRIRRCRPEFGEASRQYFAKHRMTRTRR